MKFILPFLKKNSHIIRHPETVLKNQTKENHMFDKFYRDNNRFPEVGEDYSYTMKVGNTEKNVNRKFGDTKMETIVSGNSQLNFDENYEIFDSIVDKPNNEYVDEYVLTNLKKSLDVLSDRERKIIEGTFTENKTNQQIAETIFPITINEHVLMNNNSRNNIKIYYNNNNTTETFTFFVNLHGLQEQTIQRKQFDVFKGGNNVITIPITETVKNVEHNGENVPYEIKEGVLILKLQLKNGICISAQKISMLMNNILIKLRKNKNVLKIKKHIYA